MPICVYARSADLVITTVLLLVPPFYGEATQAYGINLLDKRSRIAAVRRASRGEDWFVTSGRP